MKVNLILLGLIFNFTGSFILFLVSVFGKWHQKTYTNKWTKRYWWSGWKPIFKIHPPSGKAKWVIKLNHHVVREGFIPPRHLWNSIGFLFIAVGFLLQLLSILISV